MTNLKEWVIQSYLSVLNQSISKAKAQIKQNSYLLTLSEEIHYKSKESNI